jgi:hypothetical protein
MKWKLYEEKKTTLGQPNPGQKFATSGQKFATSGRISVISFRNSAILSLSGLRSDDLTERSDGLC